MMRMCSFLLLGLFLMLWCYSTTAQYSSASLSTSWTNHGSIDRFSSDNSSCRAILFDDTYTVGFVPGFVCGFYCNGPCTSYLFAIFIAVSYHNLSPKVVWSANRDHPVSEGAILNLTAAGDLVLRDVDGTTVWTTKTTGKSVASMNLTSDGNLVLFDVNNSVVWQSFDHPTDCLVPGQKLFEGQKLIPSVSSTNWTSQQGLYSLQLTDEGIFAYIGSNPPQVYAQYLIPQTTPKDRITFHITYGSLSFFIHSVEKSVHVIMLKKPEASSTRYIKLMPDGHLKMFESQTDPFGWTVVADLLISPGECREPLACGRNAICSNDQQCICPISSSLRVDYFKAVNDQHPKQGCSEITPVSCNATQDLVLVEFKNITYFSIIPDMKRVDVKTCKQACLRNCSCKAAIFSYRDNSLSGNCSLPSELFTLRIVYPSELINATTFIKVQNVTAPPSFASQNLGLLRKRKNQVATVLVSIFLVMVVGCIMLIIRKRKRNAEMDEEYLEEVPGMPTRFPYKDLKTATENFSKKLGQGGFGSVFEGTLEDGSKIAVKCLEGLAYIKKSFLTEVQSIGSIHHVNLVRLRGFCAWKSQRLLVYEFMSNGSLDRWIYHGDREHVLNWQCRKKIILDIAKGLAYLHEDCRQKIMHLDIKPQNILLDADFNAKVSDFGLSKLIDRNQSHVMTTMRGTPGYLAPEWLSSVITEKVDVYSYGIVLLEILCGRKHFDRSQPEKNRHLLVVFQKCREEGTLLDIVDTYSEDMQTHCTEVVEMMEVVSWCLQTDVTRRPSMSTVVKVLEGVVKAEHSLNYNIPEPRTQNTTIENDLTSLMPSVLSEPR